MGLGLLRLSPDQFWAMTPRELSATLRMIFGDEQAREPLARSDLAALIARYPDERNEQDG